jgi:hypothetical protein
MAFSPRDKLSANEPDSWDDGSESDTFIRWFNVALCFMIGLAAVAGFAFLRIQILGDHRPARVQEFRIMGLQPTPPEFLEPHAVDRRS